MAKFTYINRPVPGGYGEHEAIVTLPSGKKSHIPYIPSKIILAGESAIYNYLEKELRNDGLLGRYKATVRRTPTYAQLNKKGRKEEQYTRKELKAILDSISFVAQASMHYAKKKTLYDVAEESLIIATRNAGFNEYTGNLYNSYNAAVMHNGRIVFSFGPSTPHKGTVDNTSGRRARGVWIKKGNSRFSPLRINRHPLPKQGPRMGGTGKNKSRKSGNGHPIRFLKEYEKNPSKFGYRDLALGMSSLTHMHGLLDIGGKRDHRIKSGVIVQNTAPYSGAVERRYNVLSASTIRNLPSKYTSKGTQLIRVITKRSLKKAGFDIK